MDGKKLKWTELLQGVPQEFVSGPLFLNIYLDDLFWVDDYKKACNFADDSMFFATPLNPGF